MVVRFDFPSLSAVLVGEAGSGGGGGGCGGASMSIDVELAERKQATVRCRRGSRLGQSPNDPQRPCVAVPRSPAITPRGGNASLLSSFGASVPLEIHASPLATPLSLHKVSRCPLPSGNISWLIFPE